jgi:hypothetical protein
MKPSDLIPAIETCIEVRRPAFIWGPPGVGKSDLVAGIARKRKIGLIDFRMALRDPTDIKGFPMPDQKSGTMKFFRDAELPTEATHGKYGILFMDELNGAAPATQAAGMQLSLTGRIGDYVKPGGWSIIGAGNRETDRGVVHRMPTPLANRFTHMDYDVNVDDWVLWAQDNGISPELIAFMRFRPILLFTFDPSKNERAFATPRSWVAADMLRLRTKHATAAYGLVKGTVGEGPAAEYQTFLTTIADLPSVDEIKLNPDGTKIPTSPATQYAITSALANQTTLSSFARFMIYVERLPVEYQTVYVRDALRKEDGKIKTDSVFKKWSMKHQHVIV